MRLNDGVGVDVVAFTVSSGGSGESLDIRRDGERSGQLSSRTQFFCIARLLGKNPQKIGNLLPDIGGVAGQRPVGLCGRFGPAIPITKNETRRLTIVR
jgi:hypothetical protein